MIRINNPHNRSKIEQLIQEVAHAKRSADAIAIHFKLADLHKARERDKKGQMAWVVVVPTSKQAYIHHDQHTQSFFDSHVSSGYTMRSNEG